MAKAAVHDTVVRSVTAFTPKGSDGFVTTDEAFTSDYGDRSPRAGELLEKDATLERRRVITTSASASRLPEPDAPGVGLVRSSRRGLHAAGRDRRGDRARSPRRVLRRDETPPVAVRLGRRHREARHARPPPGRSARDERRHQARARAPASGTPWSRTRANSSASLQRRGHGRRDVRRRHRGGSHVVRAARSRGRLLHRARHRQGRPWQRGACERRALSRFSDRPDGPTPPSRDRLARERRSRGEARERQGVVRARRERQDPRAQSVQGSRGARHRRARRRDGDADHGPPRADARRDGAHPGRLLPQRVRVGAPRSRSRPARPRDGRGRVGTGLSRWLRAARREPAHPPPHRGGEDRRQGAPTG